MPPFTPKAGRCGDGGLFGDPACERPDNRYIVAVPPDEETSPEQIAALRRLSPEQRWRAAHRLYWTMRRHKAAFLQSQHPDWPEAHVAARVREIFSRVRT
jgi:hypothetical protein